MRRYRAGQRVADDARFTLRPGDTIVILANRRTRTLRGPGSFAANAPSRIGGLASLNSRPGRRVQTGAVRGTDPVAAVAGPTDIWQFDVSQTGRACVLPGRTPTLWRRDASTSVQLTITPPSGAPQTVTWPAGQSTLMWPAQVPVTDGGSYQLSWTGAATPIRVTTHTLSALAPDNVDAVAAAFLERECRSQLDALIATRADADGSAEAETVGTQTAAGGQ